MGDPSRSELDKMQSFAIALVIFALSFTLASAAPAVPFACSTAAPSNSSLAALQAAMPNGTVFLPGSAEYVNASSQFWMPSVTRSPIAVAHCVSSGDVSAALAWAKNLSYCVSVRSSGHSYPLTAVMNGRLLIDLSAMNTIVDIDSEGTMWVGPAVMLDQLAAAGEANQVATSWGGCPTVAMGGFMNGGEGYFAPMYGMAIDSLVGVKLVLANGTLVQCNASENADLFWAVRGGGGPGNNFGVVVDYRVQFYSVQENITSVTISTSGVQTGIKLSQAYNSLLQQMHDSFNFSVGIDWVAASNPDDILTIVSGWWWGDVNSSQEVFAALTALPGCNSSFVSGSVWDLSNAEFSAYADLPLGAWNYSTTYIYTINDVGILRSIYETLVVPDSLANGLTGMYMFVKSGYAATIAPDATAFVNRGPYADFEVYLVSNDTSAQPLASSIIDEVNEQIMNKLSEGPRQIYANYPDMNLEYHQAMHAYYGDNLPRLQRIKASVDPDFFWNFPQAITPDAEAGL